MNEWDGKERREQSMQMNQEDRDRFIRMDANLTHLVDTVDHHRADFKKHLQDDEDRFSVVFKFIWGIGGAGALLMILFNISK